MLRSSSTKINGKVPYKIASNRKRHLDQHRSPFSNTQTFFPQYQNT